MHGYVGARRKRHANGIVVQSLSVLVIRAFVLSCFKEPRQQHYLYFEIKNRCRLVCALVWTVMLAQVIHHFEEPVDHEVIFTDRQQRPPDSTVPPKSILPSFGFFFLVFFTS